MQNLEVETQPLVRTTEGERTPTSQGNLKRNAILMAIMIFGAVALFVTRHDMKNDQTSHVFLQTTTDASSISTTQTSYAPGSSVVVKYSGAGYYTNMIAVQLASATSPYALRAIAYTTAASGSYSFSNLANGNYKVSLMTTSYSTVAGPVYFSIGGAPTPKPTQSPIPSAGTCIPAGGRNGNYDVYGKITAPKNGVLKGITLNYIRGRLDFLAGTTCGGRWGFKCGAYFGYQVYLTNANKQVVFPKPGTPGLTVHSIDRCYVFTSGPLASVDTDYVNGAKLVMPFNTPMQVTAGEEFRLYTGQNLFNIGYRVDDHGDTCVMPVFDYAPPGVTVRPTTAPTPSPTLLPGAVCIPAGPRNGDVNVYGKLTAPKAGVLKGITLTYLSGMLYFQAGTSIGGKWGFTANNYYKEKGYQVYLTDASKTVVFPAAGTPGLAVLAIDKCYTFTSGPLASIDTDWVNGNTLVMQFTPMTVTAGQEFRLYTGQNLFNLAWAQDDHGQTCAMSAWSYQ